MSYRTTNQEHGNLPSLLRISCPLIFFVFFAAFSSPPGGAGKEATLSPFPTGISFALLGKLPPGKNAGLNLFVRSRTHAERSRTAETPDQAREEAFRAALCVASLAHLEDASDFPWRDWIEKVKGPNPKLGTWLLQAAARIPEVDILSLARIFSHRDAPPGLRLQGHLLLWRAAPAEAFQKGRKIFRTEVPRAQHQFPGLYVERVLLPRIGKDADDLLREAAAAPTLSSWARVQAIRELARRSHTRELGGLFLTLFLSEERDLAVRKESLLALLKVDPLSGKEVLLQKIPPRASRPVLHAFMAELRVIHGLPHVPNN